MNARRKRFLSSLKRLRGQEYEPIGYEGALNNPNSQVYWLEYRGHKLDRHPIVLIAENGHVTYWDRDYTQIDRPPVRTLKPQAATTWRPLGLHVG